MLFNSIEFLIFFPAVTILYFLLPHKYRWFHLLAASCIFYAAFIPIYLLVLFFTIVVDYFAGLLIEKHTGRKRKVFLTLSIITNVGILAVFKYYNFFIENINALLHNVTNSSSYDLSLLGIILPIGLSFHTFQAMSYTIEVYRGNQKAERHFGVYSLYVMFYPQLVAGPIERPQNILHQFYEKKEFSYENAIRGLKLMLWGMFKKVVIADRLALLTDPVFNNPAEYPALTLAVAAVFFSFQIFCDFSGYSDIARGAARVMGFELMVNFNRPYSSKSISEFWKKWHISLSTWFRDYLYIPLGGNRVSVPKWYFNLFFVFLISGFWHGANWTYIIWGGIHGLYLIFALLKDKAIQGSLLPERFRTVTRFINVLTVFFLVTLAWIFFRANSVADALYFIKKLPMAVPELIHAVQVKDFNLGNIGSFMPIDQLLLSFIVIIVMELVHYVQSKRDISHLVSEQPLYRRWLIYYSSVAAIVVLGVFEERQFIYFQF